MKQPELIRFGVPRETEAQLRDYVALLMRWNSRINLTAERDETTIWRRHVLDSMQIAPLIPPSLGPLVDIGSGAGFPGLMLAVANQRETHLVELDRRKAAFLIEAARVLGLSHVTIHPTRIENATLPPAAIVTARALARLPTLIMHAYRILAQGGVAIFPKGRTAAQELTDASSAWIMHVERFQSRTDPAATILRLSEIHPAGFHA